MKRNIMYFSDVGKIFSRMSQVIQYVRDVRALRSADGNNLPTHHHYLWMNSHPRLSHLYKNVDAFFHSLSL